MKGTDGDKTNPLSNHPILTTSIATGIGAGLFYKYATGKLLNSTSLPPEIRSEFNVLSGQMELFHPRAIEDIEMKEMNETIRRYSAEDNIDGIIGYTTERIETNRELLEDTREIEKTIFKIRGMINGLPKTQQKQLQEGISHLLEFEQVFYSTLKIQRTILELIQNTYRTMKESASETIPDTTKLRIKSLSKEYSDAILNLAKSTDSFQDSAPVNTVGSNSTSTDWGIVAVKVVVAIVSILGAIFVALISSLGKMNKK